ncbi:MAG: VWA domain-containing protein, partial [Victivallales bacterium]|nr:VWA domain-containing protein [Victivallales bacterium]
MLALLIPAVATLWLWPPRSAWERCLRGLLYVVMTAGLAGLHWRLPAAPGVCIAVVDQSASMSSQSISEAEALLHQLDKGRSGRSRLGVLAFAEKVQVNKGADDLDFARLSPFKDERNGSLLAEALNKALLLIPEGTPARILYLGDGQWSGPAPDECFARAAARGVSVDYRLWTPDTSRDVTLTAFSAPAAVQVGEAFSLHCLVSSPGAFEGRLRIRGGEGEWTTRTIVLRQGMNQFFWQDSLTAPGTVRYMAEIQVPGLADTCLENNRAQHLVTAQGQRKILLLSNTPSGNLGRVLTEAALEVERRAPGAGRLTPELLANASCVVLENVPAGHLGQGGMELLAGLVRAGAVGMLMTGGERSFAQGGYYQSPLEGILPVSLLQQHEEHRAKVAIAVALDRSGSMSMHVGDRTKMDLANQGTAEICRLLRPTDELAVLAVDTNPHVVVPLTTLEKQEECIQRILSIESMGGGIFVYEALKAAAEQLLDSTAQIRHIVLFADAADSEQPGDYLTLLATLRDAGVTVSVIGLGSPADPDSELLTSVALEGGGTIYFTERAEELPRLFAEDTFQVAKRTFLAEAITGRFTPAAPMLSTVLTGTLAAGGYNQCWPIPDAQVALAQEDGEKLPLAAFHQAGLGRTAAFCLEADGAHTGPMANDPRSATLLASLVKW